MKILSDRVSKTLENDILLYNALIAIDKLNVTLDHREYGITTHERLHLMEAIKVFKNRTAGILAEEAPKPTEGLFNYGNT